MYGDKDPYNDYVNRNQQNYDEYPSEQYGDYNQQYQDQQQYPSPQPPPPPPRPQYQPGYGPYPPPPRTEKSLLIPLIVIVVVFAVVLPIIAGVLYVWSDRDEGDGIGGDNYEGGGIEDDNFEGEWSTGISISANKADKNIYYSVEIVKVSGGSLQLSDAKFLLVTSSGAQLINKDYRDAYPSSISVSDTTVYPIPSRPYSPVTENATNGDGATVDSNSVDNPTYFEYCYFVIVDSETDGKINSGDCFWIYKDYNDDGTNEITSGYKFKILDGDGNEVLTKEL